MTNVGPAVVKATASTALSRGKMPLSRDTNGRDARGMAAKKNSLVGNINKRKKSGKSRSKKTSTVSKESYAEMEKGWPKKKASTKKKTAAKK